MLFYDLHIIFNALSIFRTMILRFYVYYITILSELSILKDTTSNLKYIL